MYVLFHTSSNCRLVVVFGQTSFLAGEFEEKRYVYLYAPIESPSSQNKVPVARPVSSNITINPNGFLRLLKRGKNNVKQT